MADLLWAFTNVPPIVILVKLVLTNQKLWNAAILLLENPECLLQTKIKSENIGNKTTNTGFHVMILLLFQAGMLNNVNTMISITESNIFMVKTAD